MLPFHRIICPLDFSEPSEKALQAATEIATQFRAELVLVHVIPPPAPGLAADPTFAFTGTEEFETAIRTQAEDQLTLVANNLPEGIQSRRVIATGDGADEIARIANDQSADLIVIATHGLTGWRRLVFGSVAEKVIRLSKHPVLVIPIHEPK